MKERKRAKGDSASSKKAKQQDHPVEQKSSAEWGERIETGKVIARGGKNQTSRERGNGTAALVPFHVAHVFNV